MDQMLFPSASWCSPPVIWAWDQHWEYTSLCLPELANGYWVIANSWAANIAVCASQAALLTPWSKVLLLQVMVRWFAAGAPQTLLILMVSQLIIIVSNWKSIFCCHNTNFQTKLCCNLIKMCLIFNSAKSNWRKTDLMNLLHLKWLACPTIELLQ